MGATEYPMSSMDVMHLSRWCECLLVEDVAFAQVGEFQCELVKYRFEKFGCCSKFCGALLVDYRD